MPNQGTTTPARQGEARRVARRQTAAQPVIVTIHTNGTPDAENECCRWSWVALDRAGNVVRRESGIYGNGYGVTPNVAKFHGLIQALAWLAVNAPGARVSVLSDLRLAVETVTGKMRAKEGHVKLLASTAGRFLSRTKATLALTRREQNRAAQPSAAVCLVVKGAGARV